MAISVQCPECDHEWEAQASKAGRTINCPGCGEPVRAERNGRSHSAASGHHRRPTRADPNLARTLLIGGSVLLLGIVAMLGIRLATLASEDSSDTDASVAADTTDASAGSADADGAAIVIPENSLQQPETDTAASVETPAVSVTHTTSETSEPIGTVMNSDRGRELMAAMDDVGLRVTGFQQDIRGVVTAAVKESVTAAIEQCRLTVRPPTVEPLMLVELQLREGRLVMSAQLIAKDDQRQVKVWARSGTVTDLSDEATTTGILPPNLRRDVKVFFTSLRAEFNDARRQFGQ